MVHYSPLGLFGIFQAMSFTHPENCGCHHCLPGSRAVTRHRAIEITIANVGLVPKLDALGAALVAVREAHRDGMPPKCWAALHRAQEAIADAILSAGGSESSLTQLLPMSNQSATTAPVPPSHNSKPLTAERADGNFPRDQDRRLAAECHVQAIVDKIIAVEPSVEFGEREGPCVVEYRDWWERGWPMRRCFSCLGCRHHERDPEYRDSLCNHPDFLAAHGCHQHVATNSWWRLELAEINAFSCPVLRRAGVRAHCPPPPRDELPGRERSKAYRRHFPSEEAEIFSIPQRMPYYSAEAYARGETVDSQNPKY